MGSREITCKTCGQTFTVQTGHRSGRLPSMCKPCRAESDKASNRRKSYRWREANPEKWQAIQSRANTKRLADPEHRREKREREARRLYGIEPEELRRLMEAQGGKCAVCGYVPPEGDDSLPLPRGHASTRLHVDHCHGSGRIRGLLCGKCNTMIGLANEDPAVLAAAIEYLNRE